MKTISIILLAFVCVKFTIAQTYYPIVDNNEKIWKSVSLYGGDTTSYSIDSVRFVCDTLINSRVYKKILEYTKRYISYPPHMGWGYFHEYFFLREDSTKKVFIIAPNGSENLLYDFNLNVNDTFYYYNDIYCVCVVHTIDSVMIGSNYRKRIILYYPEDYDSIPDIWIEGIGSITSPFLRPYLNNPCATGGGIFRFACYYENNVLVYNNPMPPYNSCMITGIDYTNSDNYNIELKDGVLNITISSGDRNYFYLYNSIGQLLLEENINGFAQINLKSKGVNNGVLFYRITNGIEPIKIGKLILLKD